MKLLIIEDDFLTRKLYKTVFVENGFDIVEAEDGRNVCDLMQSHNPDAVIMELRLPFKSGLDIAGEIKALPGCSKVPIIAVTGYSAAHGRRLGPKSGLDAYLTKPLSIWKLVETVFDLINAPDTYQGPKVADDLTSICLARMSV